MANAKSISTRLRTPRRPSVNLVKSSVNPWMIMTIVMSDVTKTSQIKYNYEL